MNDSVFFILIFAIQMQSMTKNIFLLIVFLLLAFSPKAQQWIPLDEEKYLQQITQQIHSGKTDTVRLHHYLLLAEYWAQSDSLKSREALQQVINIATSSPNYGGLGLSKDLDIPEKDVAELIFMASACE